MKLLVATQNKGKLREYRELLTALNIDVVGTDEVGLGDFDVEETGSTFEENAVLKAKAFAQASGLHALADDSGLAVDALDGAPGVYSARYGTPDLDDAGRRGYLLEKLKDTPDEKRGAHFMCVIAVADPETLECEIAVGKCEGRILHEERGAGGFGYDRLFLPDGHHETFAEMPHEIKNVISHRGLATRAALPILEKIAAQA